MPDTPVFRDVEGQEIAQGTPEHQAAYSAWEKAEARRVSENQTAEVAQLKVDLKAATDKLAGLGDKPEEIKRKLAIVDKLASAFGVDTDPKSAEARAIFNDFKAIVPPGVKKLLDMLENDPDAMERLNARVDAPVFARAADMNVQAHSAVLAAAKAGGLKGSAEEMNEMVFPFEQAITNIINNNAELRTRFMSGDTGVAAELFNRMWKPHAAVRLRDKQARMSPTPFPKAPPKGSTAPAGTTDTKPDLKTPQGRAAFHKNAVGKFLNRASGQSDE